MAFVIHHAPRHSKTVYNYSLDTSKSQVILQKVSSLYSKEVKSQTELQSIFSTRKKDDFNVLLIISFVAYQTQEKVPRSLSPPSVVGAERVGQSLLGRVGLGARGPRGHAGRARAPPPAPHLPQAVSQHHAVGSLSAPC